LASGKLVFVRRNKNYKGGNGMNRIKGMGWERDLPDFRDLSSHDDEVGRILNQSKPLKAAKKTLPSRLDCQYRAVWVTINEESLKGSLLCMISIIDKNVCPIAKH
jgi:hypothetical protein